MVRAALEEDVQGVVISSSQGGHVEYFTYLVERLAEAGAVTSRCSAGDCAGGIALLRKRGVTIFSPEDGQRLGLPRMINELVRACDPDGRSDERQGAASFRQLPVGEQDRSSSCLAWYGTTSVALPSGVPRSRRQPGLPASAVGAPWSPLKPRDVPGVAAVRPPSTVRTEPVT